MKSTIKSLAVLALAALSAVSCQKETAQDKESVSGKRIEVSVTGLMGEYQAADATKADLVNTVRVNWVDGDTVYAYTTEGYIGLLLASLDENDGRYAKLSGEIDDPQGKVVTLVHSPLLTDGNKETILVNKKICFDLSKQDGEKVPFVVYGTLDAEELTVTNAIIPFKFATSVAKVNCTGLAEGKDITKAKLIGVNTVCELTLKESAEAMAIGTTKSIIYRGGNAFKTEDSRSIFQIAIAATTEAQPSARVLKILQSGTSGFVADFADDEFDIGKSYNSVYTMTAVIPYVEIAGRKWYKWNLGVADINDLGKYHAWGETGGHMPSGTIFSSYNFNWSTSGGNYSLCDDSGGDEQIAFVTDADENKILPPSNDAATVELGSPWRVPMTADFIALDQACGGTGADAQPLQPSSAISVTEGKVSQGKYWLSGTTEVLSGVSELQEITVAGLLYSDGNGHHLFFPAAGYGTGSNLEGAGEIVCYCSSVRSTDPKCMCRMVFINEYGLYMKNDSYRCIGYPVRSVMDVTADVE